MSRNLLIVGSVVIILLFVSSIAQAQPQLGFAYERASTHPRHGVSLYGDYMPTRSTTSFTWGARLSVQYQRERGHFQGLLAKTREQAFRVGLTPVVHRAVSPAEFYGGIGAGAELFHRKLVTDDALPDIAYSEHNKYDVGPFVEGVIGGRVHLHSLIVPFLEYHLLKAWHSEEVFNVARTPVRSTSSSIRIGLTMKL